MTYFTFLAIFLAVPILILLTFIWRRQSGQEKAPLSLRTMGFVIGIHVVLAVTWTTLWDNYLVATGVWWYDPALVAGITIGYVPIEEYTFFVLQPIMTGLWLIFLMPHVYKPASLPGDSGLRFRVGTILMVAVLWLFSVGLLSIGFKPGTYLGLELVWALPPIMLQLAFGADILRKQWRLVLLTIASATLFLSLADAIAIGAGTWAIDPAQSTGILIGGILPVEELIFFVLTNVLIVFGTTLALADESKYRLRALINAASQRLVHLDSAVSFSRRPR